MKHKKVAKIGIVFALAISILTNSVGNMFAQQEGQVEEYTSEDHGNEGEVTIKEEIAISEESIEESLELEISEIEEKEENAGKEKQTASYTLSKSKFRSLHIGQPFITHIEFTDQPLPEEVPNIDLSENGDGSVVGNIVEIVNEGKLKLIVTTNTPGVKVKFPSDSSNLFADYKNNQYYVITRESIDLSNVDTSEVVNMLGMFVGIWNLTNLDLSSFNTSNVNNMSYMFFGLRHLNNLNINNFDTSSVKDMSYMFQRSFSLTDLDLSHFNTSNVEDMSYMFSSCQGLNNLNIRNFDTSSVKNMSGMFRDTRLTGLDLSHFDTSNVIDMSYMFEETSNLNNLNISSFDTSSVKNMSGMFRNTRLTALDLSHFDTSNVIDMSYMFEGMSNLNNLNISSFDTSSTELMERMFFNCSSLTNLDLTRFNTVNVKNMGSMFSGCTSLNELDLNNFNTANVNDMSYMFQNCSSLAIIHSEAWDTSKVTRDDNMFWGCNQIVGKSEYGIATSYDSSRINKSMATPNGGYFTVPGLIEWNAIVKYVDENSQVIRTQNLIATNKQPVITVERIKEFIPYGYETVQELIPFTVTQDNQVFEVIVRVVEWTVELQYQTIDGTVIKSEQIQIVKPNPIVTSQTITNGVPIGYEPIEQVMDWTATTDGDIKVVEVREIQWEVSLEYQTADGTVVKEEQIQVTQLNPVVTSQTISEKVPTGYELVDSASDWTVTSNGEKKIIQVREIEWTVSLQYQTADGTVVKTEAIQVTQLNPVVTSQTISEKVPTGYELVDSASDWTVTSNGEKKIIQVREIEWTVNLEYQTAGGNVVKTEAIQITQPNPVVPAQTISEKVPTGYELVGPASDWTAIANGDKKVIQVREIEWVANLEYQTVDGTVVKTEAIQVTQLNPVVPAQTITEKVPVGYELVDIATDWIANVNGDKKVIQVREIEWTVNLEYQTLDGNVVKTEAIQVTQLNPVVTAQVITEKTPGSYELAEEVTDWTATSNGEKKVIQVREIQWTVNLEYQTADGTVVKAEAIQVTQLNPVVTTQVITEKVPTGYELVDPAIDWTVASNGEKKVIQVREVQWTVNLEYQTADGNVVKTETIQVTQLNPVVSAQTITNGVPTGYELVNPATDWTATSNGEKKVIQVREVQWEVSLEYQTADGAIIKEETIQVTQLNPVVTAQMITDGVPTGYELVDPAIDWTVASNGEKKVIQVREVQWTVNLEYQTADGNVVKTETIQVTQLNPVVSAQTITNGVPTGYELVNPATDWTATSNGEKKVIQVREVQWEVSLEYQTADGAIIKEETIQVTQLNPVVTAQMITDGVPAGYELVDPATDWTVASNGEKKVIQVREIEWTIMVEFVTENSRGVVETVTFTVGDLNPVIEAQQIMNAIPEGYYALNEIQDLRATKDGEVFQIVVVKIEDWEGIVHFVDQNGVTVKTEVYKVTNKDPMIRVEELEKAIPVEATLVNPLTELTVTKDKEEFIIEVIMPVEEQPGVDDDTTTDEVQPEGSIEGAQTGDTTQMGLWTILMGGSVGVLTYLKRKKKNLHI